MGTDGWNDVVIAGTCFLEQHRIIHACLIEQTDVRGSSRKLLPVGPVATDVTVLAALAVKCVFNAGMSAGWHHLVTHQ